MYLKAYTAEEIGEVSGLEATGKALRDVVSGISEDLLKSQKATFSEESWQAPIYNVWTFAKVDRVGA